MAPRPKRLSAVLDGIAAEGSGERVRLDAVLGHFGRASFGPLLLLPALIAVMPVIGALPGVSITMALVALIVSLQMLAGRKTPWLPRAVAGFSLPRDKLDRAVATLRPWAERVEAVFRPRWRWLTTGPMRRFGGILATVLAFAMLVGALVPGAIVPPALPMIAFALGLIVRDGVLIAFSFVLTLGLGGALAWILL